MDPIINSFKKWCITAEEEIEIAWFILMEEIIAEIMAHEKMGLLVTQSTQYFIYLGSWRTARIRRSMIGKLGECERVL